MGGGLAWAGMMAWDAGPSQMSRPSLLKTLRNGKKAPSCVVIRTLPVCLAGGEKSNIPG